MQAKKAHRISDSSYSKLLKDQDYRCGICQTELDLTGNRTSNSIVIDHDHNCCTSTRSCGKCTRGILCVKCNAGIGFMRDDPILLLAAARYLLRGYEESEKLEIGLDLSNLSYSLF